MRPLFDTPTRDEELLNNFNNLSNRFDIAKLLQIPYKNLIYILYRNQPKYYKEFNIQKKSGSVRKILAPQSSLKIIQRRLNYILKLKYKPKTSVHGFSVGRSVKTNAQKHIKSGEVFNIDLENFFPSIHFGRVRGMFKSKPFNFPLNVATILAQICCYQRQLPQGAPTSPIISNLICRKLDDELQKLAKNNHCTYTRYADDITFSSSTKLDKKIVETFSLEENTNNRLHAEAGDVLNTIITQNLFKINIQKVRILKRYNRQEVTGLVVNEKLNIKRKYLKIVRTILHNCEILGIPEAEKIYFNNEQQTKWGINTSRSLKDVLQGKLAYIKQVKGEGDSTWRKLENRYLRKFKGFTFDKYLTEGFSSIQSSLWIIKCGNGKQGTGFVLKDLGLITCRHVVENFINDRTEIQVYKFDSPHFTYHGSVIAEDKDADIAILTLDQHGLDDAPFYEKSSSPAKHSDPLTVCGFPYFDDNHSLRIQTSEYVQTRNVNGIDRILVRDMQYGGMSGGPVLDTNRNVVGIIVTGIRLGQDMSKTLEFGITPISAIDRIRIPTII